MAKVITRYGQEYECKISDMTLKQGKGLECCEGLFMFEPLIIDFGGNLDDRAHTQSILDGKYETLHIKTQFQTIWLIGIADIAYVGGGKLAIKFENFMLL